MTKYVAYTDASCRSPDSAWGYLIVDDMPNDRLATNQPADLGNFIAHGHGILPNSTNNQGEITAIYRAVLQLLNLPVREQCVIISDSQYALGGMTTWREGWKRRKFVKVKNMEFWQPLWSAFDDLQSVCHVSTLHVRGHQGIVGNEYADSLSRAMFSLSPKAQRKQLKDTIWTTSGENRHGQ